MKNKRNVDKEIASLILRAQNASDGGKGIDYLVASKKAHRDNCHAYSGKDFFILTAIGMIARNNTSFKFAVRDGEITPYLVYFETSFGGTKYQVSFHSYCSDLERYMKKGFRILWDHGDSRDSAYEIYLHFNKHGRYV